MGKVERLRWRLERGKGDGKDEKVKEQVQGASLASEMLSQWEWSRWVTRSRPKYILSAGTVRTFAHGNAAQWIPSSAPQIES